MHILNYQILILQLEMRKVNEEIKAKSQQIASIEKQMADSILATQGKIDKLENSLVNIFGKFTEMIDTSGF